jgi:hypothetical protein
VTVTSPDGTALEKSYGLWSEPGDPSCDKTACKPGDPGCEEKPRETHPSPKANPVGFAYWVLNRADYYTRVTGADCAADFVACKSRSKVLSATVQFECEIGMHHTYGLIGGGVFCAGVLGAVEVALDPERGCEREYERCLQVSGSR